MKVALAAAAMCLASCGYTVSGHTDLLPKTIQTICVPAFANATIRYKTHRPDGRRGGQGIHLAQPLSHCQRSQHR